MNPFPKAVGRNDYIQEGANPAPDVVLLACTLGDDYDNPMSRVIVVRGDLVLAFDFEGEEVVSIDADGAGAAWVLGENGTVMRFDWRTPASSADLAASAQRIANPAVEDLGPLRRLRLLGSEVVCAGSVGQAYRLDVDRFVPLPQLLVDGSDVTIEDLAGVSASDFTVATSDGFGARFDGRAWHKLELPSSSSLNTICRCPDGRYAIAGDNDTLLIGAADQWQAIPLPEEERDFWGIAAEGESLYLSHIGGIEVYGGGALKSVKIPRRARNEFVVLRSGPDGIWSFAGRSVGLISGGQWQVLA